VVTAETVNRTSAEAAKIDEPVGWGRWGERDQDDPATRVSGAVAAQPAPQLRLDLDEHLVDVLAEVAAASRSP
jgi:hypothetical protein